MPTSKSKDDLAPTKIHGEKIILILRPKVKIIQSSRMYVTHYLMVKHSCARYGMTISINKKAVAQTQSHIKYPIQLTLRSKVNIISG